MKTSFENILYFMPLQTCLYLHKPNSWLFFLSLVSCEYSVATIEWQPNSVRKWLTFLSLYRMCKHSHSSARSLHSVCEDIRKVTGLDPKDKPLPFHCDSLSSVCSLQVKGSDWRESWRQLLKLCITCSIKNSGSFLSHCFSSEKMNSSELIF